jgi:hypothetical protein
MSYAPRFGMVLAAAMAGAIGLAPCATADPDIDSESAASVIEQLREEGFAVTVNGVPSGDTALLTTCVVTAIHDSDAPSTDPSATTPVSVDVACPIQRG